MAAPARLTASATSCAAGATPRGCPSARATALGRAPRLTRPLRAEIGWLAALLALELDPGHGAGLHPADPRVPEIRLLADAVARLIEEIAASEPAAPAARAVLAVPSMPRASRSPRDAPRAEPPAATRPRRLDPGPALRGAAGTARCSAGAQEGERNMLFVDFEASGLSGGSWPIELGLAWIERGKARSASRLIRPHPSWPEAVWSAESAEMHRIPRRALDRAWPAERVAAWAAGRMAG